MQGRKPVPTALRIARGNPRKHTISRDEPVPPPAVDLAVPALLESDADARRAWDDTAPMLQRLGVFTTADRDALILYCVTFARWQQAERELRTKGSVVAYRKGSKAPIVSPYVAIANQLAAQCRALLTEFGLTPVSRTRLHVPKDDGSDQKDKFFGARPRSKPA